MFSDRRSKYIILVAHCILNQNSISDGTADFPSQFTDLVDLLMEKNIGIMQLPCPEVMCLGLGREDTDGATRELLHENSRIRRLLEQPNKTEIMQELIKPIVYQIDEYKRYGMTIIGIIGVNRSPSCGVDTTSIDNKEEPGKGIFIETLLKDLEARGHRIKAIGTKTSEVKESILRVRKLIE